jgi:hypothetical protein
MKISIIFITCFFFTGRANSQTWQFDATGNAAYLQHLFFNGFDGALIANNTYFIFTQHQADEYWKKKNRDKSEILISKVDEKGDITFVQKLDNYVGSSLKKFYNNKFYILATTSTLNKGKYYYPFFIYDAKWQLEKQIFFPESSDHQRGFSDFAVDTDGYIYLTSSPYFLDHEQQNFKGSYLIKVDTAGNFIKAILYEKSFLQSLQLNNDTLSMTAYKQKLIYPFYQTDSVISIKLNRSLDNLKQVASSAAIKKDDGYLRTLYLKNGTKVIFIDSSYNIDANTWTSTHKIAMLDQNGNRKWTVETPRNFIVSHSTAKELDDGTFLVEILKKWIADRVYDTTCIVQFDATGRQKDIKKFLDGANPRMEGYFVSSFFEAKPNEVWLFYRKSFPNRQERVYFEKLILDNKK